MRTPSFTEVGPGPVDERARSFMVRMRDGVRLATDVYLPATDAPVAAVLTRLPYDKSGSMVSVDLAARLVTARGYAFVAQDTRGKFRSEGETIPWLYEANDGYDTIEWIVNQVWSDGRVGMHGSSYVGFTQWAALSTDHPRLRAITPRNTCIRLGGRELSAGEPEWSFHVRYLIDFYAANHRYEPDGDLDWDHRPLVDVIEAAAAGMGHRSSVLDHFLSRDGQLHRYPAGHPFAAKPIPVLLSAGWFDPYHVSRAIEDFQVLQATPAWSPLVHLRLTPHDHEDTRLDDLPIGDDEMPGRDRIARWLDEDLRFFDRYLRDDAGAAAPPPVSYELVHDDRVRTAPGWPPPEARRDELHLVDGTPRGLARVAADASSTVSWIHDPDDLVRTSPQLWAMFLAEHPDFRERLAHPHTLTFRGEPGDEPLRLAGPVTLRARVSSTGPRMDLFGLLLDLEPDGTARFISQGQRRLTAPTPTDVEMSVGHAGYVLRPGHALALVLSSSDYPDFVPLTGTDERWWTATEMRSTTQALHLGGDGGATLTLTVIPADGGAEPD